MKFAHSCKKIEHLVVKNKNKTNYLSSKVKPVRSEVTVPWSNTEVHLKSALVETIWGPICCYIAGKVRGEH